MVTKKMRQKQPGGTIVDLDFGCKGENVTQDATHRFVTDTEKSTWNDKASNAAFTGATANAAGLMGLVPTPAAGNNKKYLRGDATWENVDDHTAAFSQASSLVNIASGEKLTVMLGKIAKAIADFISHANNKSNPHGVTKAQVGLGNADNTSDVNKPVSTAQQAAIDAAYANSNYYTDEKIAALINGAPTTLDTLGEIAQAMQDNQDVVTALEQAIGTKANEADFEGHTGNSTIHITATERTNWNNGSANYGICSTAAATAAKVVACTGFGLTTGAEITVKFAVTNTAANPTLNVNSTGAKPIYYRGSAITAGHLGANRTYAFRYNGAQWDMVGDINTNTTYSNMTAATASAAGKAGLVPAPGAGKQGAYFRGDGTWEIVDDHTAVFSSDDSTSPAAWTDVAALVSGEKHSSIFNKVSTMFKNVRYIWKLLGDTDISSIGDGTITGALNTLGTNLSAKCSVLKNSAVSVSTPSETITGVTSLSLPAGVWLVFSIVHFSKNANGYRRINLHSTAGYNGGWVVSAEPCSGNSTIVNGCEVITTTNTTTYYVNVIQNSGETLTADAYLRAIRLQ